MLHHHCRILFFISRLFICLLAIALPAAARGAAISIANIDQLQKIGNDPAYPLSGSYELAGDIDAAATKNWNKGAGFSPIGTAAAGFIGNLNGRGHVLRGLYINRPQTSHIGLFAALGPGAAISNTGITAASITGASLVGGFAGSNMKGAIKNCYSSGTVHGISRVGGLAGTTTGAITNCFSTAQVSAAGNDAGGLVGYNAGGIITTCFSTGAISGKGPSVGGLVGASTKGTAANCFWDMGTSRRTTSSGGTGRTTADMLSRQTFSKAGWDFVHVWDILDGRTYPWLRRASDVPAAAQDMYAADSHTPLMIAAPGVLANDKNPWSDTLTATIVKAPSHGTLTLQADGSFTYTTDGMFIGTDNFTYAAHAGSAESAPASVTIKVANKGPSAAADSYRASKNNQLSITAPGVLANDTDAGGDNLTAVIKAAPAHGNLALHADGSFIYTPAEFGFTGTDNFSYAAKNRAYLGNTATVTLTFENKPPIARADSYGTAKDAVLMTHAPGVLGNDYDPNWDNLTAIIASPPSHGTLVLNPDGSCIYTPAAGFTGTDSFTYIATDGMQNSAPATVTIIVTSHALEAAPDSYSTLLNTPLSITWPGLLINDTDAEGHKLTALLTAPPAHGTLALKADGSFLYTPASGFTGADSFSYKVNDGAQDTAPAMVTITVMSHAISAAQDNYSTEKNAPLSVAAPGVLANDTDTDNHSLTAALVAAPEHGIFALNADGSFMYIPNTGFTGADWFTYTASDGAEHTPPATVTLTISQPALMAAADTYKTEKNSRLEVPAPGVLDNDSDPNGTGMTAILVRAPAHGGLTLHADGSFTYTPAAGFTGTDSFAYKANDGADNSSAATVMTAVSTSQLTAAADSYSTKKNAPLSVAAPGVLANDTAAQGTKLTALTAGGPTHGKLALKPDGSFIYTPAAGFTGSDNFTYTAGDGIQSSPPVRVAITVASHALSAEPDSYSIEKNTPFQLPAPGVLINDSDEQNHSLSALPAEGPAHGTLTLSADGAFIYIPDTGFTGTDSFSYKASDGTEDSSPATVSLTVANSEPEAYEDRYSTEKNTPLAVAAPGVLDNDSDPNGDTLKTILIAGPSYGTLALQASGSFTYLPSPDFSGTDSFTYLATDGTDNSTAATVTITVNSHRIAAGEDSYGGERSTPLSIAPPGVLANDSDAEGNKLRATLVSNPDRGSLVLNADGSFTYTPGTDFCGTDSFIYKATDGFEDSPPSTVTITVNSHRLSAGADSYRAEKNKSLSVAAPGLLVNDSDALGHPLTALLVKTPLHGTLAMSAQGSFIYTADKGFSGTDSFTYKASDGTEDSPPAAVTITSTNRGPAPATDSYATEKNGLLSVAAPGVLANDTDPDADSLMALPAGAPSHGELTVNADGSFTYIPARDFKGTDNFTYMATDGTDNSSAVRVVIAVKAQPDASADSYSTQKNTPLLVAFPGVLENDSAANSGKLLAISVRTTAHGSLALNIDGSFLYIPDAGFTGTDSFTYTAKEGAAEAPPAAVTITVNSHGLSARADSYGTEKNKPLSVAAPGVLDNDTDAKSHSLTAVPESAPSHGTLTLSADGSFIYTPDKDYIGTDSFTYKAHDGAENSAPATVAINVTAHVGPPETINGEHAPEADTLRAYRDKVLEHTPSGQAARRLYDRITPTVDILLGQSVVLKQAAGRIIQKLLPEAWKKTGVAQGTQDNATGAKR
jgi:VCBS repeat-containing protein